MANRSLSNEVTVEVHVPPQREEQGNALTAGATRTLKLCEAFVIESPQDFELAAQELRKVGISIDALDSHRKDMTRPIDEAKKKIMDKFKPAIALLEQAKSALNGKMMGYRSEQERKRREEQRKAEEAAAKERERLEAEAKKLAKKSPGKAAELREQAAQTVAPVVAAAAVPTVKGVGTRKTWKCGEDVDVIELCRAVVDGRVPALAIEPNFVFLNEQARSLEGHFDARFPGCRAVSDEKFGRTRS